MGKIKKLLGGIVGLFVLFAIIGAFLPSDNESKAETKIVEEKTTPSTKTTTTTTTSSAKKTTPTKPTTSTTTKTTEESSDWRDSTPTDASGWHIKGSLYEMEDDDCTNALKCYEKALQLDPKNRDALAGIGLLKAKLGDYTSALKYYNTIIDYYPEDITALDMKALYLEKLGRLNDAIEVYDHIIEITPDDGSLGSKLTLGNAWHQKALLYSKMGNSEQYRRCEEMAKNY